MTLPKRLYRSRTNRMVAGVCGGLGDYANVDPVLVRLFFVILAFANGLGILLYLVAMVIIPEEPTVVAEPAGDAPKKEKE